jgi:hypothetical protein
LKFLASCKLNENMPSITHEDFVQRISATRTSLLQKSVDFSQTQIVARLGRVNSQCGEAAGEAAGEAGAGEANFSEGQLVVAVWPKKPGKFEPRWQGPYSVKERCGSNSFRCQHLASGKWQLFSAAQIKVYYYDADIVPAFPEDDTYTKKKHTHTHTHREVPLWPSASET